MERQALARALRFLNYLPVAKWTALVASICAGVLFVVLVGILGLFIDLIVSRGELPTWPHLSARQRQQFEDLHALPDDAGERQVYLTQLKEMIAGLVDNAAWQRLALSATPERLSVQHQQFRRQLLWLAHLPALVEAKAGPEAASAVRATLAEHFQNQGVDQALVQPLANFGILGLVIRADDSPLGPALVELARWNPWMWRHGNHYYLQGLFLIVLGVAVIRMGLVFLANYMAARATLEAMTRLRRAVYHHTHRLGSLAFRAVGPTEAVSVSTRHLEVVHTGLYVWLTVMFREPVKFLLLLSFAMLLHVWLAATFLLFAVVVWIVGGQVAAHYRRQGRIPEQRAAEQMVLIQESLMLMRLVKVYVMELFNQSRVERQLAGYAQARLQRYRGEALYRPLFALLGLAAAVTLLLLAGSVVLDGQLAVASGMVMVAALVCLYWPAVKYVEARRSLRRARHAAKALFDFLDRPGSVGQAVEAEFLPAMTDSLEFDNVTFLEPGTGHKLLRGLTLTISAGQKIALVGSDAMERHALVYLIPRFLDPQAGEVRIDGKNLRWVTLDSLRIQAAMVLQHNLVFNDTVANNIGCGDPTYPLHRIIAAAKIAHAHHFVQKLPHGYQTAIGDLGHTLNAGEMFRIALARAILREPALLIIEEPTTQLDEATKAMIDDTYTRILPRRTVIFLPHRLSTLKLCDRVVLLHQGKIEAAGEHRELVEFNDLYRHLQYLEFNEFAGLQPNDVAAEAS